MSTLAQLPTGAVFAHDFRVVRPLAEGGMGSVYVVEQLSTGRERALKLMQPQFVADPANRRRFADEARAGSRIESDHIVEVIASGVDDATGVPWLAMELLLGQTLAERVKTRGPVPPTEAHDILRQACHGLGAAHRAGIVHRDVKPENIFLSATRRESATVLVKLLDFGIAKVIQDAHAAATGNIGTPLWMAPEQTESRGPIGPQADVWALGLVAFYLLTGREFWLSAAGPEVSVPAMMRELLFEPMPLASARAAQLGVAALVPPNFDAWFARAVARDPAARFADATVAAQTLEAALLGGAPVRTLAMPAGAPGVPATVSMEAFSAAALSPGAMIALQPAPVARVEPAARHPRRRSRAPWIVGGLVALAGGGVALALALRPATPAHVLVPAAPAAAPVAAPVAPPPAPAPPVEPVEPAVTAPVHHPAVQHPAATHVAPHPTPATPTPATPTPATPTPTPATPTPPTPATPTADVPTAAAPAQNAAFNQLIQQGEQMGRERIAQQLERYLAQNPNAPDANAIRQRIAALRAPAATP